MKSMMRKMIILIITMSLVFGLQTVSFASEPEYILSDDSSGFVLLSELVPDAILEIRYYSTYNFVGDRIDGYEEPLAFLTKEAAEALKEVSDDLVSQGYRIKIFDAYRPQKAVTNFMNWALDEEDVRMKEYFYPELDKDVLFPQGYIAEYSGHSRGSTVDLTLFDMKTEKEVDMGGTFDYFGELSHPDYTQITEEQYANRMILREAMLAHGFKPLDEEWWHFTLENEPYPNTYFTFPVNSDSLQENKEQVLSDSDSAEPSSENTVNQYSAAVPDIEAGIEEINKYGNIILSIGAEALRNQGYEPGDIIRVRIGDAEMEMPIGTNYSNVDYDAPICCFKVSSTKGIEVVSLAVNGGNLTETLGIAQIRSVDADPGYEIVWADGYDPSVSVTVSMAEKQGYAEEYHQREYGKSRSNNRSDYPQLDDLQFANFRGISTSGMGDGILYRSSSPIDPSLNRSREADAALSDALIRTVLNLADTEETMTQYPEYYQTAYSDSDIIALNMSMDFNTDEMNRKLAEGLRFMTDHDGPYLIHCKEGKDRTGYVCGVLEALMGAGADEIVTDYMLTYYNFFGVEPGTEQYQKTADNGIRPILAEVFGVDSIETPGLNLSQLAEEYLQRIGMSSEEITALKNKLSESR